MRNRLTATLAIAVVLCMFATPAAAGNLVHGDWDIDLYLATCDDGRLVTWSGTVELGGYVYGMADFPTVPTVFRGQNAYFEENWTIFKLPDAPGADALIEATCDPDRVILRGHDKGFAAGAWAGAKGSVDAVGPMTDPYGFLDSSFVGYRTGWGGSFTGPTSFLGHMRFFPASR